MLCLPLQCQLFPLTWLQVLAARLLTGSALDQSPPLLWDETSAQFFLGGYTEGGHLEKEKPPLGMGLANDI